MDKLFLLDAYALIYRAYYAFIKNPRINSKGMNTSAVMGFVNTLNEILTKEHPTHIGVARRSATRLSLPIRRNARRRLRTYAPPYPSSRISLLP